MTECISDEEALGRARRGDRSGYEVLARRYHRRLHKVAQRILRNPDDAEDAVQGAHLLALRHLDQFAGRSSFLTWMTAITIREAVGQIRRRIKWPIALDHDHVSFCASSDRNPEQQAMDADIHATVGKVLNALPPAYRAVFRLRELEEMSSAQTGQRLGLTEACVKTRLFRARALLQERLARGPGKPVGAPACQWSGGRPYEDQRGDHSDCRG